MPKSHSSTDYNYDTLAYELKPKEYFGYKRKEMISFIPESAQKVLEVGCGSGVFGQALKAQRPGISVWGIEPNEHAAKLARNNIDRSICGLFAADLPELKGKKFDCICFNDVLEHMVNPEQALIDCKSYLSPTGVVVASIPNILFFSVILEILLKQDWRYREEGVLDSTPSILYEEKHRKNVELNGYDVNNIEGISQSAGLKYTIAAVLTLGFTKDWKYPQFAVSARPK